MEWYSVVLDNVAIARFREMTSEEKKNWRLLSYHQNKAARKGKEWSVSWEHLR